MDLVHKIDLDDSSMRCGELTLIRLCEMIQLKFARYAMGKYFFGAKDRIRRRIRIVVVSARIITIDVLNRKAVVRSGLV